MLKKGSLKPTVFENVFHGLEQVPDALKALGDRGTWGKVVVQVIQDSKL